MSRTTELILIGFSVIDRGVSGATQRVLFIPDFPWDRDLHVKIFFTSFPCARTKILYEIIKQFLYQIR